VVVVSGNDEDEDTQLAMMGLHGAQLLDRLLEPGDIVGFSWGRAVSALVENLPQAGATLILNVICHAFYHKSVSGSTMQICLAK
ncbi:sugar-binding domain-containing protein, partial [Pseudomonas aeruginosa]|uniref:sugar-binding domain-containing protein n=1 Tax=Pseudomonas aeruginosa TaxID=287 RepID=UPI0031B6EE9C